MNGLETGKFGQKIDVAKNQSAFGDDPGRMTAFGQDFENAPRQPQLAFDRLIRIGVSAENDGFRAIGRLFEFASEQLGGIVLCNDLGLEIQARVQAPVTMRRAREAVDAPVLAAGIRVDGPVERDIRRVVGRDDRPCGLVNNLRRHLP